MFFTLTFKRIAMNATGIKRNRSCLINQVVHRIHWLSPIIFMVSRIRVSFSRTSSLSGQEELQNEETITEICMQKELHLDKDAG